MDYILRALQLARQAFGDTNPNPPVGAVVVNQGTIVGEGHTQPPGQPHAEIMALRQAGEKARGGILYVTLEPCCHFGRTPPCTQEIIAAKVKEVHCSMADPNPLVAGRGLAELQEADIQVFVGEGAGEARELAEAHTKFVITGLPFVTAKFAMSLDGKIATSTGESRWISGQESRALTHSLRSSIDAIVVGVNTVLRDDPQLTARGANGSPFSHQPLRVVVDSKGRTPLTARLLQESGKSLIACTESFPPEREQQLRALGAEVLRLPARRERVDLHALLETLGQRQLISVLVEGGSTLLSEMFAQQLVDKVIAFIAPMIIGGVAAPTPIGGEGITKLSEALRLHRIRVERSGEDVAIIAYTG